MRRSGSTDALINVQVPLILSPHRTTRLQFNSIVVILKALKNFQSMSAFLSVYHSNEIGRRDRGHTHLSPLTPLAHSLTQLWHGMWTGDEACATHWRNPHRQRRHREVPDTLRLVCVFSRGGEGAGLHRQVNSSSPNLE